MKRRHVASTSAKVATFALVDATGLALGCGQEASFGFSRGSFRTDLSYGETKVLLAGVSEPPPLQGDGAAYGRHENPQHFHHRSARSCDVGCCPRRSTMLPRPRPLLESASESLAERHTALRVEAGTGMLKHQTAQRNTNRTAQARLQGGGVATLVGAACAHVHVSFVAGWHTVRRCSAHDGSMVLFKVTETHLATGTHSHQKKSRKCDTTEQAASS